MLKKIGIGLLILLIALVAVGFFLPTTYEVSRTVEIAASPKAVHAYVNDLKRWDAWEPWTEDDPTIETTLGEKTQGVGASQSWTGRDGKGRLVFTSSDPAKGVDFDLFFDQDGTEYACKAGLHYADAGEKSTKVTWSMKGDAKIPVIGGYLALAMDRMVGPMFDRGLEKLKAAAEGKGKADAAATPGA